jgi:PAS domain S-box-containing protein
LGKLRSGIERTELGWLLAGAALVTVVGVAAAAASAGVIPAGALVVAALVVAAGDGPRATAVVAAYAFAVEVALGAIDGMFLESGHFLRVLVVGAGGGLAVWISSLRKRTERAEARSRFLADAGARLDSSLDYGKTVKTLTQVAVPRVSDWCAVYVTADNGAIRQLAVTHTDHAKEAVAWELERRWPFHVDQPLGVAHVIRSGNAELLEEIPDEAIDLTAYDEEHARHLRELGLRSAMFVPLRARGRTLGAMAFATAESGRTLGQADFSFAQDLAERAALAVDNARLHTAVAETQASVSRAATEVQAILHGVASAITVQDRRGGLVYANEAAARALGFDSVQELLDTPPAKIMESFEVFDEDQKPLPLEDLPGRLALESGRAAERIVFFLDRTTGEERWSLVRASPIVGRDGETARVVNVFDDITPQKQSELAERFLSESSRLLTASLEYETTLDNVAHLAVPGFADWCAVDLVDERGAIKRVALTHSDPAKIQMADELRIRYPTDPSEDRGLVHVIRTGEAELYPEIPEEMLVEGARDERHLALLRDLGLRSAIVAPMTIGGRTIGALTFVTSESRRRFDEKDLELARELGRRAAASVENARLYEERSHIAQTLQRSLLPPVLPEIPGVEVAARFRPAGKGFEVGGDFYDVFNTGAGWGIVIGDVCGKGPEAAALTGLARHTLRAAAMQAPEPSSVLGVLHEAIRREHSDSQFCTAAYVRLELRSVGVLATIASGGHPLPLLLAEDGTVTEVGRSGPLLGSYPEVELADEPLAMAPGTAIVLYTDGVIESGVPRGAFGLEGLKSLLSSCVGLSANEIAERVDTAVLGLSEEPPDDVAVLVLRVRE